MKDYMSGRLIAEVTDPETEKASRITLGDLVENPGVDELKAVKTALFNISEDPVTRLTYTHTYIVL